MNPSVLLAAAGVEPPPLALEIRIPLSALMFLEFAIWGAWWVVLGNYLESLRFSRKDIGRIYATIPIASIVAPMLVGTIADRFFASEQLMGVLHLAGAALLYWMARVPTPRAFFWVSLAYALVYAPTLALVNSVTFANVPDATRDFPTVRVLGTIGWILAGMSLHLFIKPGQRVNNRPLLLAAALSLVLGVFSFFLPHTPPKATSEIPFLNALQLLGDPSFALFFGVAVLITIASFFYFSFTGLYLENDVKVRPQNVGPLMTIGQWVEIFFMFTLAWFIRELGMKTVLVLGMTAWGLRYAIFASRPPLPLILVGIGLHGICFDFFFAAGFIYVDNTAPNEIRASSQSLFSVLTYGFGMYLGSEASGWLNQRFTKEVTDPQGKTVKVTNWTAFWLVPCVAVIVCLIAFLLLF